jgi:hypothetical protein
MGYKSSDRCLDRVDEDEPIFVLRAQDQTSINIIHRWLEGARETLTPERAAGVRTVIDEFAHWQASNPGRVKAPD